MKVIVGLGNPGEQYLGTRHNVGVMVVDTIANGLASDYGWRKNFNSLVFKTSDLVLVKTKDVFMNESGRLLQGLPEGELYVVHDDLDIRLGEYKIQNGVGPKLHYGVQSIENQLGRKDFLRVRIGVDNRDSQNRTPGEDYVLQKFTQEEKTIIEGVIKTIADEINQPDSR